MTRTNAAPFHLHLVWGGWGVSWHRFPAMRTWHGLQELHAPSEAMQNVHPWREGGVFLGWSARVPRGRLEVIWTGWARFLPIPAFRWWSYFGTTLYKGPGTAERNGTQLEETGNETSDMVWRLAARARCWKAKIPRSGTLRLLAGEQV